MKLRGLALPFGIALFIGACGGSDDPLAEHDKRYRQIMMDLASADRDTTRRVRNREARKRKIAAEKARVKFFHSKKVQAAIKEAASTEGGGILAVKAAAYQRHALIASSWTEEEKAEETRLLGRLDELSSIEATWTSPDGAVEVALSGRWRDASQAATALSVADRDSLAMDWKQHQMQVVGPDLQALVQLRNTVGKRAGYNNYWELALASQGLTPANVNKIISDLTTVVGPTALDVAARIDAAATELGVPNNFIHRSALRKHIGMGSVKTAADQYFDTELAEERVMTAFQDMGISTRGWQVHTNPPRYTRSGVYGFPIRPPSSVAIVMSQDNRWTMWQYEALAHEGGHAVWWQSISKELARSPVLWAPPRTLVRGVRPVLRASRLRARLQQPLRA